MFSRVPEAHINSSICLFGGFEVSFGLTCGFKSGFTPSKGLFLIICSLDMQS